MCVIFGTIAKYSAWVSNPRHLEPNSLAPNGQSTSLHLSVCSWLLYGQTHMVIPSQSPSLPSVSVNPSLYVHILLVMVHAHIIFDTQSVLNLQIHFQLNYLLTDTLMYLDILRANYPLSFTHAFRYDIVKNKMVARPIQSR